MFLSQITHFANIDIFKHETNISLYKITFLQKYHNICVKKNKSGFCYHEKRI